MFGKTIEVVRDSGTVAVGSTCLDRIYLQLLYYYTYDVEKNNYFIIYNIFVVYVSTDQLFSCSIL